MISNHVELISNSKTQSVFSMTHTCAYHQFKSFHLNHPSISICQLIWNNIVIFITSVRGIIPSYQKIMCACNYDIIFDSCIIPQNTGCWIYGCVTLYIQCLRKHAEKLPNFSHISILSFAYTHAKKYKVLRYWIEIVDEFIDLYRELTKLIAIMCGVVYAYTAPMCFAGKQE